MISQENNQQDNKKTLLKNNSFFIAFKTVKVKDYFVIIKVMYFNNQY